MKIKGVGTLNVENKAFWHYWHISVDPMFVVLRLVSGFEISGEVCPDLSREVCLSSQTFLLDGGVLWIGLYSAWQMLSPSLR